MLEIRKSQNVSNQRKSTFTNRSSVNNGKDLPQQQSFNESPDKLAGKNQNLD